MYFLVAKNAIDKLKSLTMNIDKFFKEKGYLPSYLPKYNLRLNQLEAANIVATALDDFKNAIIEAPTGSGKTMAYLIPAFESKKKIIISTKTKQLMNQIYFKDIPTVKKFMDTSTDVKLLKGRKNYFCPNRFYRLVIPHTTYYPDAVNWFEEEIKNGISEAPWGKLDNEVCNLMTADRFQCKARKCEVYDDCPFYLKRAEANNADITITNHHMFLADMGLKADGSPQGIFDYKDHAIFDEAHSLPDIYSQYAGAELSLFSIIMFLKENKSLLTPKEIDETSMFYFKIVENMKDGRILYTEIKDKVTEFIELCKNIINDKNDEDLKEEFIKYSSVADFINQDDLVGVRFAEKSDHRLVIKYIPIEIGESFSKNINEMAISSIFISATISAGGNFKYFLSETGLSENNLISEILPSNFDLKKQGKLFVPTEKECYQKDEMYKQFAKKTQGSILIICNSIDRMNQVGEMLQKEKLSKQVVFQTSLDLNNRCNLENIILVGCASLREGIDLSGAGFRCVILDKLPFEYFKDFFLDCKAEKIKKETGDSFMNFYLPRALLYFKQSVGRLIRHEKDYGLWVVLDSRILTKNYGKYFLDVIDNVEIIKDINGALNFINGGANE